MFQVEFLQRTIVGLPISTSTLSVTDTSTASPPTLEAGKMYDVVSDVDCHLDFGDTPVASATTFYLPAKNIYPVAVYAETKMAVIRYGSEDGTLWYAEKDAGQ